MFFSRKDSRARSVELLLSTALGTLFLTPAAFAQNNGSTLETVVVTGTSIRGSQPTGSNLITLDRSTIESTGAQTVQQLLTDIPGVSNFGGDPQGTQGVPAALGIHGIGQGSSTATLVLIDNHRFPGQGVAESDPDPNLIPAIALQRVEVLPDGASAIYGSDAVSGVINFVTRKDFTGMETSIQAGAADHYNSFDAAGVFGHAWTGGSVLAAYEYSSQSNLMNGVRDYMTTRQDIRRGAADPALFTGITSTPPASGGVAAMTVTPAAGPGTTGPYSTAIPFPSTGFNFQNFACPVATIATSSSAAAFYYQPTGGYGGPSFYTSTTNLPSQGACDNYKSISSLPAVTANSGMIQVRQELSSTLSADLEVVYGSHVASGRSSRGTVSATVFGPSAPAANATQINPFYVGNSTTGNTSEFIRYDFNQLLGAGAGSKTATTALFMTGGLTWDLGDDRELVLNTTIGANGIATHNFGTVSQAEVLLALNGTTNTTGSLTQAAGQDVYALGTNYPGTRTLNTLNALDVWNPVATNKTAPQVLRSIQDGGTVTQAYQGIQDASLKFDGPVFDLPAGKVKIAVGGEFLHAYFDEYGTRTSTAGPSLSNSAAYYYRNGRQIYSAFVEVSVPLVSPEMGMPLMQSVTLDMSGRYDRYNDFGDTTNPKVGVDWIITDGLKARASYGTSFVAPNLHDKNAFNSQSNITGGSNQFASPIIPFNDTRPFNGGAGLAGTWVTTGPSCSAGNGTPVDANGVAVAATSSAAVGCKVNWTGNANSAGNSFSLTIPGGNGNLHPATGRNYSVGLDLNFGKWLDVLDGLTANVTYYDFMYHGLITNQQTQNVLPQTVTFAPIGGWTPTSAYIQSFIAGRSVTTVLQPTIWGTYDNRLQNAYNVWENGIDFGADYNFRTDNAGAFRLGISGNEMLRYTTQGGNTGPLLDSKAGKNAPRFPSQELQFRAHVGWSIGSLSTDLGMNYIHPTNITVSQYPYNFPGPDRGFLQGAEGAEVFTSAGTAHLGALVTLDLSANYALSAGEWGLPTMVSEGSSLSFRVSNLLDTAPPFNPTTSDGYTTGNALGRMFTLGLRKKW